MRFGIIQNKKHQIFCRSSSETNKILQKLVENIVVRSSTRIRTSYSSRWSSFYHAVLDMYSWKNRERWNVVSECRYCSFNGDQLSSFSRSNTSCLFLPLFGINLGWTLDCCQSTFIQIIDLLNRKGSILLMSGFQI